jgi:hypothetical protein
MGAKKQKKKPQATSVSKLSTSDSLQDLEMIGDSLRINLSNQKHTSKIYDLRTEFTREVVNRLQ